MLVAGQDLESAHAPRWQQRRLAMLAPQPQRQRAGVLALRRLLPVAELGMVAVVPPGEEERPLAGEPFESAPYGVRLEGCATDSERHVPELWLGHGCASLSAEQDQVVAVHDLAGVARAERRRQVPGGPAEKRRQLFRVVVDQSAGHRVAVFVDQLDRIARGKVAVDPHDTRWQE